MPRYAITEKAGPFVATYRNSGVGTVLELTERQAEHELRLGTLTALDIARAETQPRLEETSEATDDAAAVDAAVDAAVEVKPRRNARS